MLDLFAGCGAGAIQPLRDAVTGGAMTLAGIAAIIGALAKLVKEVSDAITRLRPPK